MDWILNRAKRVALRPADKADVPLLFGWLASPEAATIHSFSILYHFQYFDDFVRRWEGRLQDPLNPFLMIERLPDHEPIGTLTLHSINPAHGHAQVLVFTRPEFARGAYWLAAMKAGADLAFNGYNLRKLYFSIIGDNRELLKLPARLGFVRSEGKLSEYFYYNGQFWDMHILSMESADWLRFRSGDMSLSTLMSVSLIEASGGDGVMGKAIRKLTGDGAKRR